MKTFNTFITEAAKNQPQRDAFEAEVKKHRDALSQATGKSLHTTFKHMSGESRAKIHLVDVDHRVVKKYLQKRFGSADHEQGNQIYGSNKLDMVSHRTPIHPERGTMQGNVGIHIIKYHE